MTAVPQADVEAHRTTSSKADSHGGQSRWRRVTMVDHSSPEQSARHLPERLGETRWLFMEVLRVNLNFDPSALPAARQVQRLVARYQDG